jgi:hypothetical protein
MSKPFVALIFLFFGFIAGILTWAGLFEYENKKAHNIIDEAVVLAVPKNEDEIQKQLLYLSASKALLEEIQRQRMMKRK